MRNLIASIGSVNVGDLEKLTGYRIRIINLAGREVFNENISDTLSTINLTDFGEKGMYFIEVLNGDGLQIDVRKILLE